MPSDPLYVHAYTVTSACGAGNAANLAALEAGRSGLAPCDFPGAETLPTWIGTVAGLDAVRLPPALADYDCRNNRLALLGLEQDGFLGAVAKALRRHGPERVAVILGSSTGGIEQLERAYRAAASELERLPDWFHYAQTLNLEGLCAFVAALTGAKGPRYVISTACSSGAKAFVSARRLLRAGFCDAAVVGGVDSLCLTTLYGFNALQLLSAQPCRPCDARRDGLSLGEAAAFALVDRDEEAELALLGAGESSDGHHMSAPDPGGEGARLAMQGALADAGLPAAAVEHVNLHGTGTRANDRVEGAAVAALFGDVPCTSTKAVTGHTLGAAGAVEAAYALLCLKHGLLPGNPALETPDPDIPLNLPRRSLRRPLTRVLSNAFGFGGSNVSLLFGREART